MPESSPISLEADLLEVAELVSQLVSIASVNPAIDPSSAGEAALATFVEDWLCQRGVEVAREPTGLPGRDNVIARVRGNGGGRTLLLNAHMDTVGTDEMQDPFVARREGARLHGRGAQDTKGGLAAYMLAVASSRRLKLSGDVVFTAVVDEEHGSAGTIACLRTLDADGALVAEPTALEAVCCHKGFQWLDVHTEGVAAHGSRPDRGVDAIAHMGHAIVALDRLAAEVAGRPGHPTLGTGSLHCSLVRGGQEMSSYPARCQLSVERRTLPGESRDDVEREIQAALDASASGRSRQPVQMLTSLERPALQTPDTAEIVTHLRAATEAVTGRRPGSVGQAAWTDAALIAEAGIPAVVFGPSGDGLHTPTEWVDLESVATCSDAVLATIRTFCA
jgi:acetylornithine deacetylase